MSWKDIIKARKPVPPKFIRDEIDKFMSTVEGKVRFKEVNQHLMKKMGMRAMSVKPNAVRTYLYGWHSDKAEEFDPNVMRVDDYYYDLEE
tara:strand:- start:21447 stop:21716 length:270 start_codon:yes stop_codon:yes gene_type:complete